MNPTEINWNQPHNWDPGFEWLSAGRHAHAPERRPMGLYSLATLNAGFAQQQAEQPLGRVDRTPGRTDSKQAEPALVSRCYQAPNNTATLVHARGVSGLQRQARGIHTAWPRRGQRGLLCHCTQGFKYGRSALHQSLRYQLYGDH